MIELCDQIFASLVWTKGPLPHDTLPVFFGYHFAYLSTLPILPSRFVERVGNRFRLGHLFAGHRIDDGGHEQAHLILRRRLRRT